MQGTRQPNKLWTIDKQEHHSLNSVIDAPTIAERIEFYSRSLFSPTLSTLAAAIKVGYLSTFPSITTKQLRRWPPNQLATYKGHMHAKRANLQSTKKIQQASNNITLTPLVPPSIHLTPYSTNRTTTLPLSATESATTPNIDGTTPTSQVYAACQQITGQIFTDQTGQFTIPSSSGNKYVFILYDYDSNYIDTVLMPSRTKHQILIAYHKSIKMLKRRGLKPQLQRLDNEASDILREFMQDKDIKFQLTPAPPTQQHRKSDPYI